MAETAERRHLGGCLCGDLRFEARGEPDRVGICHCLDCRKQTGAPFAALAIFEREAVTVTGDFGNFAGRCFCPRCGGSVFSLWEGEIELSLGAFDDAQSFAPSYELWCLRRASWLPPFPLEAHFLRDRGGEEV